MLCLMVLKLTDQNNLITTVKHEDINNKLFKIAKVFAGRVGLNSEHINYIILFQALSNVISIYKIL